MKIRLDQATVDINDAEQYSRKNSVRIYGLCPSEGSNVVEAVIIFFKDKLGIDVKNTDICAAHPVKAGYGRMGKKTAILVKFLRSCDKISIIKARRKLKGLPFSVHEDLTKKNLTLLHKVRTDSSVDDAWFASGSVWAKQGDHKFRVGIHQDVNEAAHMSTFRRARGARTSWRRDRDNHGVSHQVSHSSTPINSRLMDIATTEGASSNGE